MPGTIMNERSFVNGQRSRGVDAAVAILRLQQLGLWIMWNRRVKITALCPRRVCRAEGHQWARPVEVRYWIGPVEVHSSGPCQGRRASPSRPFRKPLFRFLHQSG